MVKKLTLIFLLFSNLCLAQSKIEYANFIQTDTAVKWAAVYDSYINLTTVNPNFNIRNFYVNKLKGLGATAYIQDSTSFSVTPLRLNYEQYKASIKEDFEWEKRNWEFNYDDKHTAFEGIFANDSNSCDSCILNNKISFFKVKQLFYYRNNQFKIQNILLSPVIYTKETGSAKEKAKYFETSNFAFNEIKNADAPVPASAKFIGRSCSNLFLLPADSNSTSETRILTMNDWNITRFLYAGVKQKKLKAYNTDKSVYPDPKNILDYRKIDEYGVEQVVIPIYDSTGNITAYQKIKGDILYDVLINYALIQDFYFDFDKEILYSKLVALILRKKIYTSTGYLVGLKDYWGVIFPAEKKEIVKKKK